MTFSQALNPYFQKLEAVPSVLAERVVYSNMATFIESEKIAVTEEVRAELTAFEFIENFTGKPSVWNTYYQPLIYAINGETVHQVPDINAQ